MGICPPSAVGEDRRCRSPAFGWYGGGVWVWEYLLGVWAVTESVPTQGAPARHGNKMGLVSRNLRSEGRGGVV